MASNETIRNLTRFGASRAREIGKAAVLFTLGAAIFVAENDRQGDAKIKRNDRRKAYEGRDASRETERAWLLGVTIAAKHAETLVTILATANDVSADALVSELSRRLIHEASEDQDDDGNPIVLTDPQGRIVWSRLDAWVSRGAAKAAKSPVEKVTAMRKAVKKACEDCDATSAEKMVEALDELVAAARAEVASLKDRARAFALIQAAGTVPDAAASRAVMDAARAAVDQMAA